MEDVPPGYRRFGFGPDDKLFKVHETQKTFRQAQVDCNAEGGELITFESAEDLHTARILAGA